MTADRNEKLKALALAPLRATNAVKAEQALADFHDAANPATVLELCNENTELRAEVERLREAVKTRDALLRALNAVAIERGDKFGACDCIDNKGNPYPSQHLADVLAAGAPSTGTKEKA